MANTSVIIGIAIAIVAAGGIGAYALFSQPSSPGVQTFELVMTDFAYNGEGYQGFQGGPTLTLQQGVPVRIDVSNAGSLDHEFMIVSAYELEEALEALEHEAAEEHMEEGMAAMEEEEHGAAGHLEVAMGEMLLLKPGESGVVEFVPDQAGEFAIACFVENPEVHIALGMHATLIVQ